MTEKPHDDEHGVAFPLVDGRRSTTATGRAVFADAARPVDPALAEQVEAEADWRTRYVAHVRALQEAGLRSASASLTVAQAGLDSLHDRFELVRDGRADPLASALAGVTSASSRLHTVDVRGEARGGAPELSVPYRGEELRGDALHRRLDGWVDAGIAEPSFAGAIRRVMANPDWLDLSDRRVAVLGAGAEMGPLSWLCRWGAHVLPVDLPEPAVWGPILQAIRSGRGRASVPVRTDAPEELAAAAGADLVHELPEVAAWLDRVEGALTIGNYVYADGAAHVRVAMAADALTVHLAARRADCTLAFLVTPTDVFAVPEEVVDMARRRYEDRPATGLLESAARAATRGRLFAPNYEGVATTAEGCRFGIADSLVPQQGPNYALAKSLQRWRAVTARRDGLMVSANVAPPSGTRSVVKNRLLAAAYAGAHRFGVEVFDPPTANTLMAALLVHDLRHPAAGAKPDAPLGHPQRLFAENAIHGGLWRNPFAPRSVLGLAVVIGMVPGMR